MSDEISSSVGNISAKIHSGASEDAWSKRFSPSPVNNRVPKEAVELSWQEKYGLAFLTIFKGIEAEAKRLLKTEDREKPDKVVASLQNSGLVSEFEFHLLNGLRGFRNEVVHGKSQELETIDKLFLHNEIEVGVLPAILLLMRLQSKYDPTTCRI